MTNTSGVIIFQTKEPISKRLKSVTPAKADLQKRTENTG
jgi:hypothetical protein